MNKFVENLNNELPSNYDKVRDYIAERRPVAKEDDPYFLILNAIRAQSSRQLIDNLPFHPVLMGWSQEDCRSLLNDLGESYQDIN
mgnify:CR=1 FL=1